ncbi:syntaxin-16-like isoform X2 [Centruroides sculpturatus]|uniref:syntaxin-16-like isoform X1 n=1 Tax=Centruroides sculpturatus TaxID=218467 RepID=UPI000C6E1815|nr:syntaxin-16-like isoform X1 [Centruroides sculpturatus]XP_023219243.1 syntaxin-16-like isoform X2 [Centruroides sculpturatus]
MAFRSLTEVFILMRNNALQSRHIYSEQVLDDRVALVSHQDVEKGITPIKDSRIPPAWVDGVEEIQYEMTKIKQKMKEISILYDKRMNRPTLDDSTAEEREIEILTQDITRMFMHCQRLVHQIRSKSQGSSMQDSRVNKNVVTCLVTSLQELSSTFRSAQSTYLRRLKSQEERSQEFFDTPLLVGSTDSSFQDNYAEKMFDQQFIKEQQLLLEDNTQLIEQREREINRIVRSIAELNEIFKDLANIVVDQGTVLDRIDYNLEQVQTKVHEGLHQLQKAENYQRKNHKMMCILILASVTVLLIILLIAFKT